ncbi:hypothetical protein LY90DRAFT_498485 [Neocallimastix californiae]|uniref:Uncharacterized protein n=1 Tax=Neocallimastix californiae TaxID=1754190 RepID=A0A1Y2FTC6_9FUNG|nr:hypothetical protein LY90DRAFT_498485 [Neocallimastix californiae]|eukprot:ORY87228.1 hypothetical protein LY90DRAFT_498485 [Neocallimastix californiae]
MNILNRAISKTYSSNKIYNNSNINNKSVSSHNNRINSNKMVSLPTTISTTSFVNNSILGSTEYNLNTVSPLSPYTEIIHDIDNYNSKINSPFYGFDNNLNHLSNDFSSIPPYIPNNTNYINGIGTPTLSSNTASTNSVLFYSQEPMDLPSPSESCTSNNDNDGSHIKKENHSSTIFVDKLNSESNDSNDNTIKNSQESLLSSNIDHNNISTQGILENYLNDIRYPYYSSPLISDNNFQNIQQHFQFSELMNTNIYNQVIEIFLL